MPLCKVLVPPARFHRGSAVIYVQDIVDSLVYQSPIGKAVAGLNDDEGTKSAAAIVFALKLTRQD